MRLTVSPLEIAVLERTVLPDEKPLVQAACPACGGQGCDGCSQTGLAEFCSADIGKTNEIPNDQKESRWAMEPQGMPSGELRGTGPCTEPAAGADAPVKGQKRSVATIHRSECRQEGTDLAGPSEVLRACDLRGLARTEEEIEEMLALATTCTHLDSEASFDEGYFQGIADAIRWIIGETDDPPLEADDVMNRP